MPLITIRTMPAERAAWAFKTSETLCAGRPAGNRNATIEPVLPRIYFHIAFMDNRNSNKIDTGKAAGAGSPAALCAPPAPAAGIVDNCG